MYVIAVQLKVNEDRIDDFLSLSVANATEARKEPGCLRFDIVRNEKEPERFLFYEVYRDKEAHKAHGETAHYLNWREKVGDLLAEPRVSGRYVSISPADAEWA